MKKEIEELNNRFSIIEAKLMENMLDMNENPESFVVRVMYKIAGVRTSFMKGPVRFAKLVEINNPEYLQYFRYYSILSKLIEKGVIKLNQENIKYDTYSIDMDNKRKNMKVEFIKCDDSDEDDGEVVFTGILSFDEINKIIDTIISGTTSKFFISNRNVKNA